jgi:hypothetical protein
MQKVLASFNRALAKVIAFFSEGKAQAAFDSVVKLVPAAMPIVRFVAAITPTRADDEILELLERFGFSQRAAAYLALPIPERGAALRAVAISLLSKQAPNQPERILAAAVELALVADRAENPVA